MQGPAMGLGFGFGFLRELSGLLAARCRPGPSEPRNGDDRYGRRKLPQNAAAPEGGRGAALLVGFKTPGCSLWRHVAEPSSVGQAKCQGSVGSNDLN